MTAMRGMRACVEDDVTEIAALHARVWAGQPEKQVPADYLRMIFFEHPFRDDDCPSLVYVDDDGCIVGCLGVMTRRLSLNKRPLRLAISHDFVVEAGRRSTLAGVQLLRALFNGHQDLAVAEGNDLSRRIWEGLGGTTALLYSVQWTRVLRPLQYALTTSGALGAWASGLARPVSRLVDALAARQRWSPLHLTVPATTGEELTTGQMLDGLGECCADIALVPEYDRASLDWLLALLRRKHARGTLHNVMVRRGRTWLGWFIYYAGRHGRGEVVQVVARPGAIGEVLDHLFYDAWCRGLKAVSGQLEPRLLRPLSDRAGLLRYAGSSMLVHTRDPELSQALDRGDALFTRLEGEWCLNFEGDVSECSAAPERRPA